MAKELPFFKFEPGQWETGRIQLMDFEAQGVFINLCSFYWQRLGDLDFDLALQKVCGGNASVLNSLIKKKIIGHNDDKIIIEFLDEQLDEFEKISLKNKENALIGWEKRKSKATAKRPQSDRNAIREEKIREDKNNIYTEFFELFCKHSGKQIRVLNDKTKRQLNARLKEGYTLDDFKSAILNCKNDQYHKDNPKYLTPEFITRPDKLEKYMSQSNGQQTNHKQLLWDQQHGH